MNGTGVRNGGPIISNAKRNMMRGEGGGEACTYGARHVRTAVSDTNSRSRIYRPYRTVPWLCARGACWEVSSPPGCCSAVVAVSVVDFYDHARILFYNRVSAARRRTGAAQRATSSPSSSPHHRRCGKARITQRIVVITARNRISVRTACGPGPGVRLFSTPARYAMAIMRPHGARSVTITCNVSC